MLKWIQTFGQRIGILFAMTLLSALLNMAGHYQLDRGRSTLLERDHGYLKGIGRNLVDLNIHLIELRRLLEQEGADLTPQEANTARQKLDAYRQQLDALLRELDNLGDATDAATRSRFLQHIEELDAVLRAYSPGIWPRERVMGALLRLEDLGADLSEATVDKMIARHDSLIAAVDELAPWVTSIQLIVLLMLLLTYLVVQGATVLPSEAMVRHLRESATRRSMTLSLDPQALSELGSMGTALARFLDRVSGVVVAITRINQEVNQTSGELARSSASMLEGVKTQGSQATQVVQSVGDVAEHLGEMTRQSDQARERATDTVRLARGSRDVLDVTVSNMSRVSAGVDEMARSIDGLARSTERIGEVLALIEDIADQTNLLALNAAIEAARAGERGRGFAVVADEIRTLSEKISRSAHEISRILAQVQAGTTKAAELVKGNSEQVEKGFQSARESSTALQRILGNAEAFSMNIDSLAQRCGDELVVVERIALYLKGLTRSLEEATSWAQRSIESSQAVQSRSNDMQRVLDRVELTQEEKPEVVG